MSIRRCLIAGSLLLSTACAPKAASSTDAASAAVPRPNRNSNVIGTQELRDPVVAGGNAANLIRQLRPQFLRSRGPTSLSTPGSGNVQISQDFGSLQPVSALEAIEVRSLTEVRYLNAPEAQGRFGINANGGPVIVLITTRQP